jgi:hypothetical protein
MDEISAKYGKHSLHLGASYRGIGKGKADRTNGKREDLPVRDEIKRALAGS